VSPVPPSEGQKSRSMDDVIVRVQQGRLRGAPARYGYRFLGIPYARAPAETGRFAPPEPPRDWDGVRDANAFGATALQPDQGVSLARELLVPGAECLNLNVFTPVLGPARLPVLFWVHGGGFTHGGNASPWYDGSNFARDGVVMVAINYRLGAEGFLLLPGAPPNRAVLDWVQALEWVQENIAVFGGDPEKVTIAGQSSGGGSCAALLAVPSARGLFRGAICMSGSAGLEMTAEEATEVATRMAAIAGVELTLNDFDNLSDEALLAAQAKVLDARSQMSKVAALDVSLEGAFLPLAPVVDGEVMRETVLQAATSSTNKNVALLVGTTAHEFKMAMRDQDWITRDVLRDALVRSGTRPDLADEYLAMHSKDNHAETAGQVKTDRGFRVLAHRLLAAWDEAEGTGFGYEFRWAPSDGGRAAVSVHAVDLPFAFDLLGVEGMEDLAGANPPQEVADTMHGSFVSFVKDMSPGWPEYHAGERATMVFDVPCHVEYDPAALELELWGQEHGSGHLRTARSISPSLGQARP
jgi:para-nitrobenzyl esterase